MTGRIVLAATPIGNVGDGSARLWQAVQDADVVAAEDTRTLKDLLRRAGVVTSAQVVAVHDHNEADAAPALVARAQGGATVVLVSDAGMPTVSDPGYRVVVRAIAEGVPVTVLPGPSAALAALAVSGLASDRFCFEGFPPRKAGERARAFAALAGEARTMIFFEAPHRLAATLAAMAQAWGGERRASVSRELTKTYEETVRGSLAELVVWAQGGVKGEIVVVVEGARATRPSFEATVEEACARIAAGERTKEVTADLAEASGWPARELYAAVIAAR